MIKKSLLALILIMINVNAFAGLSAKYADWYGQMAATTNAGEFKTKMSNGWQGGRITFKNRISQANLMSFRSPSITAGCGGLNIYGGSFEFINGEQFEALLKDVAQNAKGYFFQLLLDNLCPECAKLAGSLQDAIQKMNSTMGNSCQLAQGIIDGIGNQVITDYDSKKTAGKAKLMGDIASDFSAIMTTTKNLVSLKKAKDTDKDDENTESEKETPNVASDSAADTNGNIVLKGLVIDKTASKFQGIVQNEDKKLLIDYIIGIVGTMVYKEGNSLVPGTNTEDTSSPKPMTFGGNLTFANLLNGDVVDLLRCADESGTVGNDEAYKYNSCLEMKPEIGHQLPSFEKQIQAVLMPESGTDFVDMLRANTNPSDAVKAVAVSMGNSVEQVKKLAGRNPGGAKSHLRKAIKVIAFETLEQMVLEILKNAKNSILKANFAEPLKSAYWPVFNANYNEMIDSISEYRETMGSTIAELNVDYENYLKNSPTSKYYDK